MNAVAALVLIPLALLGVSRVPGVATLSDAGVTTDDDTGVVPGVRGSARTVRGIAHGDSALIDLGRYLFFDPRLAGDGSMSCSSCHDPARSYTDGLALSKAYPGSDGFRNTKTILNALQQESFYWDGRLSGSDPETQVRDVITETHFMNLDGRLLLERLKQIPDYVRMFSNAFGEGAEPSFGGTLKAIAAFEKTLVTGPAPVDTDDLTPKARRGKSLFNGSAGCHSCHSGPNFTDGKAHRTGVPENEALFNDPLRHLTYRSFIKAMGVPNYMNERTDVGRFIVTKINEDRGRFITPSLRQVAKTAPYMHNGVLSTLADVVEFYRSGVSGDIDPVSLTDAEVGDIVAYLEAMSGPEPEVAVPTTPRYQVIDNWLEVRN